MSIQQNVFRLMTEAMKAGNKEDRAIYRFIKGRLDLIHTQPVSDEEAVKLFRSMLVDANTEPHGYSERERQILNSLLPRQLDYDEVVAYLESSPIVEQLRACGKDGQAMGIAMKSFSQTGKSVDGNVVKTAIAQIRNRPEVAA